MKTMVAFFYVMGFVLIGVLIGYAVASVPSESDKWYPVTGTSIGPADPSWPGASARAGNAYRWEVNDRGELRYRCLGKSTTRLFVLHPDESEVSVEPKIHQDGGGGACLCTVSCDCIKPCRCNHAKTSDQKVGE